jgi:GNAT superfamily N-acetyltransferase
MNDARVTVRAATEADADRLASLLTDEGYPAGASDIRSRLARFDAIGSHVLVAEAAGEVVGFVAMLVIPRFETTETFARIVTLVVDAGERERGIGRLLMTEAERTAKEAGVSFLEVTAGHHRPDARKLFESLGYDASVATYLRKRP